MEVKDHKVDRRDCTKIVDCRRQRWTAICALKEKLDNALLLFYKFRDIISLF